VPRRLVLCGTWYPGVSVPHSPSGLFAEATTEVGLQALVVVLKSLKVLAVVVIVIVAQGVGGTRVLAYSRLHVHVPAGGAAVLLCPSRPQHGWYPAGKHRGVRWRYRHAVQWWLVQYRVG
jgi:hypothetical protein